MDIFSWQDFDEMYFNCELGEFEYGTVFPVICFDKKRLLLSFYEDEGSSIYSILEM